MVPIQKHFWIQFFLLCTDKPSAGSSQLARKTPVVPFPPFTPMPPQISICKITSYTATGRLFCKNWLVLGREEPSFKRCHRLSVLLQETWVHRISTCLSPFGVPLEREICTKISKPTLKRRHSLLLLIHFHLMWNSFTLGLRSHNVNGL